MKKNLIILLAISLGFVAGASAQNTGASKAKFGIKAGANLMTLGKLKFGNTDFDYNYRPGFTAGIFSEIPFGGKFMFMPEINFSQKGADVEGGAVGSTGKLETRINYIDVPIAFSYSVAPGFSIFAGPQVSFFLNQKTKSYLNGAKTDENTDKKDFSKTIAGGLVGLGYEVTPNININGRYMRDFQKGSNLDDKSYENAKSSGFSLALGYKF